jgi:glycosyltransferase involved in cell wall biosynthesis
MKSSIKQKVTSPPVNLAVIFDQVLSAGGGYQQALNVVTSIKSTNSKYYQPIFFTIYPENISILNKFEIDVIFIRLSLLKKVWLFVRSKINSRRLLHYVQKFMGFNKFENELIQHNVDLVYFVSPSSWPMYLEKLNYITTVWDLCHRDSPEFPEVYANRIFEQREFIYKKTLIKAVAIIADSELGKSNIIRRYLVDVSRIYVLPFSPALSVVNSDQIDCSTITEKFGIKKDYVFYPAQFWAHKNHVYILQGIKILSDKHNIKLDVVFSGGDTGNLDYIKSVVKSLDLTKQVYFLGFIDNEDVVSLYKKSLALVMPSYFGPTNIPPIEASVLGVPILYSDLPELTDKFKEASLLLDLKNPESLADHLLELQTNPSLREKIIQAGYDTIDKNTNSLHIDTIESICSDYKVRMNCSRKLIN